MAIINLEVPVLIFALSLACAVLIWLVATFTRFLHGYRYRAALGVPAFALSGLMGFVSMLRVELALSPGWFSAHPVIVMGFGYFGYLLFGFLGCWTAVRIGGRLDSKAQLAMLYTLLEHRKKPAQIDHGKNSNGETN